jgi:hypothetical protein
MSKPLNDSQLVAVQTIIGECGLSQLLSAIASGCDLRKEAAQGANNALRARTYSAAIATLDWLAMICDKL